ncbi:MAG: hypothetical protein JWN17_2904, partial [Frankiales bacterium]|nr:hypothetical protein [Frankiales bacterium]
SVRWARSADSAEALGIALAPAAALVAAGGLEAVRGWVS